MAATALVTGISRESHGVKLFDSLNLLSRRPPFPPIFVTRLLATGHKPAQAGVAGTFWGQMADGAAICVRDERHLLKLDILARRFSTAEQMLVDGGFTSLHDVQDAADRDVTVYGPVPTPRKAERHRYLPLKGDSEAIAAWRTRMDTDEAKAIYKDRAATAECVNAQARIAGCSACRCAVWTKSKPSCCCSPSPTTSRGCGRCQRQA